MQYNSCVARVVLEETNGRIIDMIYAFELNKDNICTKFTQWYNVNERI